MNQNCPLESSEMPALTHADADAAEIVLLNSVESFRSAVHSQISVCATDTAIGPFQARSGSIHLVWQIFEGVCSRQMQ